MPLSKERNRERMREQMRLKRAMLQPNSMLPHWVLQPNAYLKAHMNYCPDYDPVQPDNHFEHCPYIIPLIRGVN